MRTIFVYNLIIKKNLSQFLEIDLQLAVIRVAKTCLKQEIMKTEKIGLKDSFESPNPQHLCKKLKRLMFLGSCLKITYGF
jgi:hypothetical protein